MRGEWTASVTAGMSAATNVATYRRIGSVIAARESLLAMLPVTDLVMVLGMVLVTVLAMLLVMHVSHPASRAEATEATGASRNVSVVHRLRLVSPVRDLASRTRAASRSATASARPWTASAASPRMARRQVCIRTG